MAEGKNSFILYADLIHTVELLEDSSAGKLFKLILSYVNDQNPDESTHPVLKDPVLRVVFEPIKRQLKRDLKNWESEKKGRSDSGVLGNLKRWHPNLYKQVVGNKLTIEEALDKIGGNGVR